MNCREAAIQISLHVGDDLPPSEVPVLEEHLEACAVCQMEYDSYASARDALLELKEEGSLAVDLWADLEGQLADAKPAPRRSLWRRPWVGGMAAALALALGVQMWLPGDSSEPSDAVASGTNLNVGLGLPDVTPSAAVDGEGNPLTIPASLQEMLDVLRSSNTAVEPSEEDLDDPMIAAPASRRSF